MCAFIQLEKLQKRGNTRRDIEKMIMLFSDTSLYLKYQMVFNMLGFREERFLTFKDRSVYCLLTEQKTNREQ